MNWTTRTPVEFGYYWHKDASHHSPRIVEVVLVHNQIIYRHCGDAEDWLIVSHLAELWLGPIQMPEFDPEAVTK